MVILMPARTGLDIFEKVFADAGIPYRHDGSRDFFQRQEVLDLIWVLSAIDDPTDRLATWGALRSSAFALDENDLALHFADVGQLSYRAPTAGPVDAVNAALAELSDLHVMRTRLSLAETVRRVVERTRLVEFALTRSDGSQGAANLLAIIDQARLFAAARGGGLRPFVRHLRSSMTDEGLEIEATVAEETDDVVRIMTAHGAKGLEFPIVALANLNAEYRNAGEPVPRDNERFLHFRVGVGTSGGHGHFTTPDYSSANEEEKKYGAAERRRLLYVAATRARDQLVIPSVASPDRAKGLLRDVIWALPAAPELVERIPLEQLDLADQAPISLGVVTNAQVAASVAGRDAWLTELEDLKSRGREPRKIEIASSRERAQGPLAAEVATFDAALVLSQGPPVPIGDAVHMVMERLDLPEAGNLQEIADDVCREGDIVHDLADVVAMCEACLKAPSVRRALRSDSFWREVPFTTADRDPESSEPAERSPLTDGRVDLVFQDGGELVVVDYKTDKDVTEQTAAQHAIKHHAGQGQIYARALRTATGLPVREVVFVYCKAGAEVRLREGAEALVVHTES